MSNFQPLRLLAGVLFRAHMRVKLGWEIDELEERK